MNKKDRLLKLKEEIEKIEINYDFEDVYCNLRNTTIDYENETQDFLFDYVFDEYCDNEILQYMVDNNLKKYGIWAVKNLLDGIDDECGIYKIDSYGYGYDVTESDLQDIKEEILDIIESELESECE